jgi:hypothetical protein
LRGNRGKCAVLRRVAGRDQDSAGRMLKHRPLVESNSLRKLSIPMKQSPVIFSGPCRRATEIDERALRYRCPALKLAGNQKFFDGRPGIHKINFLRFAPKFRVRNFGQASILPVFSANRSPDLQGRALIATYVHRRWCNALMSTSCRCRLSRRQVYSLAETSHCGLYDSELFIETHLLSGTGSLVLNGQHDESMAVQATASDSVQEGLQREDGWGPLKEGRQTWFIRNYDHYLRSSYPSLLDDKRKERDWKRMETGDTSFRIPAE